MVRRREREWRGGVSEREVRDNEQAVSEGEVNARVGGVRRIDSVKRETVSSPQERKGWADRAKTGNQTHTVQL
jgi:hypothetical protein